MVDLLVVADRYMVDDLIVHVSEIIDKHSKLWLSFIQFSPFFSVTMDRLSALILLLENFHLRPIEAAFSAFCAVNIALLVDNGLLESLPTDLLDMIQKNLNAWADRHYDVFLYYCNSISSIF